MSDNVSKLFDGDKRCEALLDALISVLYERGNGISIPSVIGVLELAKIHIINESMD